MRVVDRQKQSIDYRLNLLGVRVQGGFCQLVAKSGDAWVTIGPKGTLPLEIPTDPTTLPLYATDTLRVTAYQYPMQHPGSDLREILALRKDFQSALNE